MDAKNVNPPEPEPDERDASDDMDMVGEAAPNGASAAFVGPSLPQPLSCSPPVNTAPHHSSRHKLPGSDEPLPGRGIVALVDGLLKRPANVAYEITHGEKLFPKLLFIVVACMLVTGLVIGSFAGGFQLLAAPIKVAVGFMLAAAMCLPSLYILNCLSGSELTLRQVFGAQMMGIATVGVLLLGFAPIAWIFSQSTSSPVFMGVMYLLFFALSCAFGLSLMKRVIAGMGGRPFRRAWLWNIVFVLVALQLCTTLRPLFGEYEGLALGEKMFFLEHWIDAMSPDMPETSGLDVVDQPY